MNELRSTGDGGASKAGPQGYFDYVRSIAADPDLALDETTRGTHRYGLITMGVLVVLIALTAYIHPLARGSAISFDWIIAAVSAAAAVLVPLTLVVLALNWYSGQQRPALGLAFFIEKLGAALILPATLVLLSLPFGVIGQAQAWQTAATLHASFRGAGLAFIYVAIFLTAYLFAAPRRLRVACVFALGFYLAFRLSSLLF